MTTRMDRRTFLQGTSFAALCAAAPSELFGVNIADAAPAPLAAQASATGASSGKLQVNLWMPTLYADFPLIDLFKTADRFWEAPGAKEDFYSLIGTDGYPSRMANGAAYYQTYCIGYLTSGDNWVITWDGTGVVSVGGPTTGVTYSLASRATNRLEYSISSQTLPLFSSFRLIIRIQAISAKISNIRIFRKSHEKALAGGQKFNPDFLALYRGVGRIRFMDWMSTNTNPIVRWQDRTTEQSWNWMGSNILPANYVGICSQSGNTYSTHALSGNPLSWTNGQLVQCVLPSPPTFASITSFSNGLNPIVVAPSHGLRTGDTVSFHSMPGSFLAPTPTFPNQTEGRFFSVAVIDSDSFSVTGINTGSWGTYTKGGLVAKQILLSVGSLPPKPLLSNTMGSVGLSTLKSNIGSPLTLVYDQIADGLVVSTGPIAGGTAFGFSVETMVDLSNQLNSHPWFCIPTCANDDFVRQFATYVRDHLNTGLVASFEYSNEVWNVGPGLTPTGVCQQRAQRLWGCLGTNGYNNYYGFRVGQIMSIISDIFAKQLNRINRVMSVFAAQPNSSQVVPRFQAPLAKLSYVPVTLIDSIAIAPYLESNRSNTANVLQIAAYKAGGASADQAMRWLDDKLRTNCGDTTPDFTLSYCSKTLFPAWKAIANAPAPGAGSKRLCMYEGGWGYIPNLEPLYGSTASLGVTLTSNDVLAFFSGYYKSSYFGQTLRDYLQAFQAAGGEFPSQYCLAGTWSNAGMWGAISPSMYGTKTAAFASLMQFNSGN